MTTRQKFADKGKSRTWESIMTAREKVPVLRTTRSRPTKRKKSKQTLNTLIRHHQVLLRSLFRHALTGKLRPETKDVLVPGHAVTGRLMTLSEGVKNRQQIGANNYQFLSRTEGHQYSSHRPQLGQGHN